MDFEAVQTEIENGKETVSDLGGHFEHRHVQQMQWSTIVIEIKENLPRHELVGGTFRAILWMYHEQHVRESGTEVGTVRVMVSRGLWCVDVDALGTVVFHHRLAGHIG